MATAAVRRRRRRGRGIAGAAGKDRRVPCGGSREASRRLSKARHRHMAVDGDGRATDGRRTGDGGVVVRGRRRRGGAAGEELRALTVCTAGLEVWKIYCRLRLGFPYRTLLRKPFLPR